MTALSIAGSDSCGGAGIQRDLVAFRDLEVAGACAITCVTAQSPDAIRSITPLPPDVVVAQVAAVFRCTSVTALKTGMLYTKEIVTAVAEVLASEGHRHIVVDPVWTSSSGTPLLEDDARDPFLEELLPLADVLTPNTLEAELLAGRSIRTVADMRDAARMIGDRFRTACVITGGHLGSGNTVNTVLSSEDMITEYSFNRVDTPDTHGTGCAFSAALTALLAKGTPLREAVQSAGDYVSEWLKRHGRARTNTD